MTEYYSIPRVRSKVYREPLRVGTVARICQVTNKTILNWINQDALKSFTTHGGHNRIWPADLHTFLDRAGIDIEFKFDDKRETRFLIVNDNPYHRELLLESFCGRFPSASVVVTQNEYEALLLVGEQKPQVVTWDLSMPRFDGVQIIEFLRGRRMDASIHVTLRHHINHEELTWCAYAGGTQEKRTGTGITEMLNYLQALLTVQSPPSRREIVQPTQQAFPCLVESNKTFGSSN